MKITQCRIAWLNKVHAHLDIFSGIFIRIHRRLRVPVMWSVKRSINSSLLEAERVRGL